MPKRRVIFLGGKSIGAFCIKHLISNAHRYNIEILGVLSKKKSSLDEEETVLNLAQKNGIAHFETLDEIPNCEFIISVQYHEILKEQHLNKAEVLAMNLHMAPLPEYRGCNQFSFAILDGKKEFGTTLHKMTTGIDDGAIIAERRFALLDSMWVEELYEKTLAESKLLFTGNIEEILKGNFGLTPQQKLIDQRGTAFHLRNEIKNIKVIDESWTTEKKKLYVRATYKKGFEKPYSLVDGQKKYYDKNSF